MKTCVSRPAMMLAVLAATAMTVSPALARGHGGWGRYHRHHDGIDGGDFLLGALVVGGIAAVAASASNNRDRQSDYPGGPDGPRDLPGDDGRYDAPPPPEDYPASGAQHDIAYGDARSALNACSAEADRGNRGVEAGGRCRRAGSRRLSRGWSHQRWAGLHLLG